MIIHQPDQVIRLEEFFRCFAFKCSTYFIIIFLFFEPYTCRYRESQFFACCHLLRKNAVCSFTEGIFCLRLADFIIKRKFSGRLINFNIQIRNTRLQRMCHTHLIRFLKDISDQPEFQVNILHTCGIIQFSGFLITGCRQCLRIFCRNAAL